MNGLKRLATKSLAVLIVALSVVSCEKIFDDEGDCTVSYRLKFRYDMNMKYADAFPHEVTSVAVYAFDKSGTLVWKGTESGDVLATADYSMKLDLPAGDYKLIGWCGLEGDLQRFEVAEMQEGVSKYDELTCKLNRDHTSEGEAYIESDLNPLYHGMEEVSLPENEDGGEYTYEMALTKDTNHLRVILQHLSGEPVDVNNFHFSISCDNGYMDYDNALLEDETITYHAWNTESGHAGVDTTRADAVTQVNVAIADLTFGRMVTDHKMMLTITNSDQEVVVHIPVIDYALLVKGNYNSKMSDQEYLDRQDEYSMTFFLDQNDRWAASSILINSWHVVLGNLDLGE